MIQVLSVMYKRMYGIGFVLCFHHIAFAQTIHQYVDSKFGASLQMKREDVVMQKWRENRFGLFIHWGLFAVAGGEWNHTMYDGASEWLMSQANLLNEEGKKQYAQMLLPKFNPTKFNPVRWASLAKKMGVKYVTITTKHHEGFCLWPSNFTDYSIKATPYKKDVLKSMVEAFQNEGLDVQFYYSIMDWHHPYYRSDVKTKSDEDTLALYLTFVKNQLIELLTLYPNIKGLWFDGQWEDGYKKNPKFGIELEKFVRNLKPNILINNRIRSDANGFLDKDYNDKPYGDYNAQYERRLPTKKDNERYQPISFDWECCMTIPPNQFGYHKQWKGHIKTSNEIIEMLTSCISMGGNFMINF